jgi:hypothetical protein
MSQRDDDLIRLLRAELARRDATPPRQGFETRVQGSVRALQRSRHVHRALAAGLGAATVAVFAVALAAGLRTHHSRGTTPAGPVPTPTPAPAIGSLMVFQTRASGSHYTTTLVDGSGRVIRTVDAPGAAYGDAHGGRALYLDDGHGGWVLHRDGSITPVQAAARAELAAAGRGVMMVDDHTAVAAVSTSDAGSRFETVDVLTGARRIVFTAAVAPGAQPSSRSAVGIIGSSRDMHTLYVLVRDMVVDGRLQRDPVVEDVDVATARVNRTRPLPAGETDMAVSPDGRLVAWQDSAIDSRRNVAYFVTHVTDIASGHTVDVVGTGIGAGGGFGPGLLFSPDGVRLMLTGHDNEATPEGIESVAEVATAGGRVLQHQQVDDPSAQSILTVRWVGADRLAYETTTTESQDGHLVGVLLTNVVDLSGSRSPAAIGNLGDFVAVLS